MSTRIELQPAAQSLPDQQNFQDRVTRLEARLQAEVEKRDRIIAVSACDNADLEQMARKQQYQLNARAETLTRDLNAHAEALTRARADRAEDSRNTGVLNERVSSLQHNLEIERQHTAFIGTAAMVGGVASVALNYLFAGVPFLVGVVAGVGIGGVSGHFYHGCQQ